MEVKTALIYKGKKALFHGIVCGLKVIKCIEGLSQYVAVIIIIIITKYKTVLVSLYIANKEIDTHHLTDCLVYYKFLWNVSIWTHFPFLYSLFHSVLIINWTLILIPQTNILSLL